MDTPQQYDDRALVYAENVGSAPFRARYHKVWYTINPGEKKIIPWHAMRLWHGNPFAEDIDQRRRYRTEEYERVRAKHGVYEHDDQLNRIPQIVYTDIESGERWWTVADDPNGDRIPSSVGSETGERNLLTMVQKLSAELEELKAQRGAPPANDAPASLYDQEEDDAPGPEIAPKARKSVTHDAPPE